MLITKLILMKNDPNFKVGDHVRISKSKNIFTKGYTPIGQERFLLLAKLKRPVPWIYAINDLNGEEIVGTFYEKELHKINQKESRISELIKRKGKKIFMKWKGYDWSFNSCIDKKDFVQK